LPLGSVASMIVVTVAHRSIKIVNKRLRLRVVGFVTLLSSDKNNQLLSGSQPAPRGGESLASPISSIFRSTPASAFLTVRTEFFKA